MFPGRCTITKLRLGDGDKDMGYIQVDETNGTIVYIEVFNDSEYGESSQNHRGKGYGRQLVELAEKYL